ncbi:hypothetical protein RhiirA4_489120 [Rhizophagus irregularis]|uniref:Uncharacterized protein n=1 Tax=Rhizophagus irregularis TaxID=588596 RepID=A0A2I1HUK1_9GLOM|nr:hypothetical protein RhiirA4_489120 [Rhizophagus irregularis]
MSDIYDELKEIKKRHEIEKHNESREEYQVDPSCLKCYIILEAMDYNRNTYAKLMEYIILTRKDGEESYPSSKKKRNKEEKKEKNC